MKKNNAIIFLTFLAAWLCSLPALSQTCDFQNPPAQAKPIMIWQWMDGVVTEEGITADLEAYSKAGIGGVQQFLVGGPMQVTVSDSANAIGTDNWRRLMQHAISECARLGLTFGTHNCPGWSSSAYPTVAPKYAMQKVVWSKTNWTTTQKKRRRPSDKATKVVLPRPEVDPQWNYYEDIAIVLVPNDSIVTPKDIIVLPPSALSDDNTIEAPLEAVAEASIYRFGHTTNGKTNAGTAPAGGVGLECDKMSREAVRHFWNAYPQELINIAGNHTGQTFQRLEIDSYEAGGQEWTKRMPEEFSARRGYDILPWLPALAGVTIGSAEQTQTFRKHWQQTVTELFAENYYGYMSQLASEHGLQLLVQPYRTGSAKPFNPINTAQIVSELAPNALICAEFWTKPETWGWKDVPRVVKTARQSGREIVLAEGFTCWPLHAWKDDPAALKLTADRAFCLGVNRLMLHAAAQNPWPNAKPGMTFGMWGTWWTPGQTWWKNGATALFAYFARCQALLQRGKYVDDWNSQQPSLTADAGGLQWIHRHDGDTDIYFIANLKDSAFAATVSVDIAGKVPEIWDTDSGQWTVAPAWQAHNGTTQVLLHFDTHQSRFLVLRTAANSMEPGLQLPQHQAVRTIPVGNKWTVAFPDIGTIRLDSLMPWNESPNPDIRYYSGTARYTTTVHLKRLNPAHRYILHLGSVKNLAVVAVNGHSCANLWHPPFHTDITDLLHKGNNTLDIDVTNLWVNRMIGDEQEEDDVEWSDAVAFGPSSTTHGIGHSMKAVPDWLRNGTPRPSAKRKAVISFKFYQKDDALLPSGLLGPVWIEETDIEH